MENCNNPISLSTYRQSNAISNGKYNRKNILYGMTKESYLKAKETYISLYTMYGWCGVTLLIQEAHIGYPRAKRIINEINSTIYGKYTN